MGNAKGTRRIFEIIAIGTNWLNEANKIRKLPENDANEAVNGLVNKPNVLFILFSNLSLKNHIITKTIVNDSWKLTLKIDNGFVMYEKMNAKAMDDNPDVFFLDNELISQNASIKNALVADIGSFIKIKYKYKIIITIILLIVFTLIKTFKISLNIKYKIPKCNPLTANRWIVPVLINRFLLLFSKDSLFPVVNAIKNDWVSFSSLE